MIHIMTFTYLIGTTMTTTVEGDDAEAFCKEKSIWLSQSSALSGQP